MRSFHLLACALVVLCTAGARAEEPPPAPPAPPTAVPAPFPDQAAFLGVCGAEVGAAAGPAHVAEFAGMGVAYVETLPVRWDAVETLPPAGSVPRYEWKPLDDTLAAWQAAGFTPILVASPASRWASEPPEHTAWARFAQERLPAADAALAVRFATGATPPKPDYWKDWQRFLRDLVERYDGDGKSDAPGLKKSLRQVQILDQVQRPTRWLGSPDEYQRLLHHAREAIDQAEARCEVVHAAVDLRGLVHAGDERQDEWKERLKLEVPATPAGLRLEVEWGMDLVMRSLEMARLFDALPHVGSGNFGEDAVNLAALRKLLEAKAATNVAVWLTQSPTRRVSRARVRLPDDRPNAAEDALRRRAIAALRPGAVPRSEDGARTPIADADLKSWLRRGTAYDLVRGAAGARLAGASRVLTYAPIDRVPPVEGEEPPDTDYQAFLVPNAFSARTPSWFAARQMNRLLLGHRRANEAPLGAPGTSVLFLFPEKAPLPWVALLLPDLGTWAGEPGKDPPAVFARVPMPAGEVDVEEIALADAPPVRRRLKVVEGLLSLDLGPAPVYVMPAR